MQPKTKTQIAIAKSAFEAGVYAQRANMKRERLLDEGTKQCPREENFETYMDRFDCVKEKK